MRFRQRTQRPHLLTIGFQVRAPGWRASAPSGSMIVAERCGTNLDERRSLSLRNPERISVPRHEAKVRDNHVIVGQRTSSFELSDCIGRDTCWRGKTQRHAHQTSIAPSATWASRYCQIRLRRGLRVAPPQSRKFTVVKDPGLETASQLCQCTGDAALTNRYGERWSGRKRVLCECRSGARGIEHDVARSRDHGGVER
jgi:hypothetical protein